MTSLISADTTLDKDMFNKLVAELPKVLKKLVVPTGRTFIKPTYKVKPSYEEAKAIIDEDEDTMFPAVGLELVAEYNFNNISGLSDDFTEAQSSYHPRVYSFLSELPAASRFTTLLAAEATELLSKSRLFINNSWMPAVVVNIEFQGDEAFNDFLDVSIHVSVMQGS